MRLGRLAGAGGPRGGDDHGLGLGELGRVGREEGQRDGGRVAAGHRDALAPRQRRPPAGQLGQAVGPGTGVRRGVELLPVRGVLEPEVRPHVDHEHLVTELLRHGGGLPVRQGQEDHVVPGEHLGGGRLEHPPGQRPQVRLQGAERLARVGVRREGPDLDLGVDQQKAEQLPAGVSARPCHCCTYHHRNPPRRWHDYTHCRTFMQRFDHPHGPP